MGIQQNSHCSGKKPSTSLNYRLQIENSSNRKLSSTVLLGDKSKDPGESQKKSKSQGEMKDQIFALYFVLSEVFELNILKSDVFKTKTF